MHGWNLAVFYNGAPKVLEAKNESRIGRIGIWIFRLGYPSQVSGTLKTKKIRLEKLE